MPVPGSGVPCESRRNGAMPGFPASVAPPTRFEKSWSRPRPEQRRLSAAHKGWQVDVGGIRRSAACHAAANGKRTNSPDYSAPEAPRHSRGSTSRDSANLSAGCTGSYVSHPRPKRWAGMRSTVSAHPRSSPARRIHEAYSAVTCSAGRSDGARNARLSGARTSLYQPAHTVARFPRQRDVGDPAEPRPPLVRPAKKWWMPWRRPFLCPTTRFQPAPNVGGCAVMAPGRRPSFRPLFVGARARRPSLCHKGKTVSKSGRAPALRQPADVRSF
jgi:hypothetical protein